MKVSVLSAVYNEEKYISEMIRSVLAQTLDDFEILFCDDGSTDRTAEIIESFAYKDGRIRLVSSGTKLGKVRAFNLAFENSTGQTIVLLGGDDILPVDSLEIRYDSIPRSRLNDKIAAYFKLITFSEERKFNGMIVPRGRRGNRSGGTVMMTRSLAEELFPIDERLATEDVWLSALTKYIACEIIDREEIVLKYRIHAGNSNPRHQNFEKANESFHKRLLTYKFIIESMRPISEPARLQLINLAEIEEKRYSGNMLGTIFAKGVSHREKAFYITHSNKILFNIRKKFYSFFSGR